MVRRPPPAPPRLGIPAYFYPWPGDLSWLSLQSVPAGAIVVIDPANGPGATADPNYQRALVAVRRAGAVIFGYVDSAYGKRSTRSLVAQARNYRSWYGVDAIFIDQIAGTADDLTYSRRISRAFRAEGFGIAMNPGQPVIDASYFDLADHVVVFEGCLADYLVQDFPHWIAQRNSDQVWHLVYAVGTAADYATAARLAARRGAGVFFANDGALPNAWDRLPPYWQTMTTQAVAKA
ncbi:MAG: spherulation-specific family 4 protein [Mycobacteriales bacterium]